MVSEILSVTDRIFCHFGLFFAPLPHWPIWKNEKNAWRHHHFTLVYQKSWQHATLVLWDRCNFHFSFWATFCPFTLLTARKIKIKKKKKEKNTWRYHHFTHVYQKLWSHNVWFLRYGVQWTNGQTDGQKKVTQGGCPT